MHSPMLPKIKSLTYKVIPAKSVDYDNAPEISEETDDFTIKVNHERAVFDLKGHFTSVRDARTIVDDFLESWQVIIGLEHGPGSLEFKYENAEYEQFSKDGKNQILLCANIMVTTSTPDNLELQISHNHLPPRPDKFKLSPDVITMFQRYKLYFKGKEPLTSMAYMCLTVFEASAKNDRNNAGKKYNVSHKVLNKLAALCAKGDELEARKTIQHRQYTTLSPEERDWIIRAVGALIRRAGEWSYDPEATLKKITMTDI